MKRVRIMKLLLIVTLLGLLGWADSWASIRTSAGKVKSLEASFVQTKELSILKRPLVSKGKLYFRKPGQLRWEYSEPLRTALLLKRGAARRYSHDGTAWREDVAGRLEPVQRVVAELELWLSGDFSESRVFSAELVRGEKTRVVLVPRSPELGRMLGRVEVTLGEKPGTVEEIALFEAGGSTRIRLENVQVNRALDERLFTGPGR
jgi:outer membrane lipoprotein-sorting protein